MHLRIPFGVYQNRVAKNKMATQSHAAAAGAFINMRWVAPVEDKDYTFGGTADRVKSLKNEIYFTSDVSADSIEALIKEMNTAIRASKDSKTGVLSRASSSSNRIILYIDSPGGTLKDCFKFIDCVEIMKRLHGVHLVTVCTGMVASAATLMAIVGDERYVTENATCMIHELFGGNIGTYTQLSSGMKRLSMYHKRILDLYERNNSTLTRDNIADLLQKETWFDAHEYVAMGFAHGVYLEQINDGVEDKGLEVTQARKRKHIRFD